MGADTKIEWADHTFNPWLGCTKVSPACDRCYAESWAKRTGNSALWKGQRRRTSKQNWRQPLKWNQEAPEKFGRPARVFCASLADVFDNQVPNAWRDDLFALIDRTPNLNWLLLTKRPQNIAKMLPEDWGRGYRNVWLGTTAEDADRYRQRWTHLVTAPCVRRFLSYEPALGPIGDLDLGRVGAPNWIIAGGESGGEARPMHQDWVRDVRDQCAEAGVPFLFKQWGEWAPGECSDGPPTRTERGAYWFDGRWSIEEITPRVAEELHIDDAPDVWRLGKKRAGRLLDGVEHNGFPA